MSASAIPGGGGNVVAGPGGGDATAPSSNTNLSNPTSINPLGGPTTPPPTQQPLGRGGLTIVARGECHFVIDRNGNRLTKCLKSRLDAQKFIMEQEGRA